jgi:hypothetical protein
MFASSLAVEGVTNVFKGGGSARKYWKSRPPLTGAYEESENGD